MIQTEPIEAFEVCHIEAIYIYSDNIKRADLYKREMNIRFYLFFSLTVFSQRNKRARKISR